MHDLQHQIGSYRGLPLQMGVMATGANYQMRGALCSVLHADRNLATLSPEGRGVGGGELREEALLLRTLGGAAAHHRRRGACTGRAYHRRLGTQYQG